MCAKKAKKNTLRHVSGPHRVQTTQRQQHNNNSPTSDKQIRHWPRPSLLLYVNIVKQNKSAFNNKIRMKYSETF